MDEEAPLDVELQKVVNMVHSNDMECTTEFAHLSDSVARPSDTIECPIVNGDTQMIDEPDQAHQFLSLLNTNFQSREDLLSIVREIGLMQGHVMVIKRSKANKYVIIGCDRGGIYKGSRIPAEKRQKKSASRLINCPFKILGKMTTEGLWKLEIESLSHNHEPSADMSGHPYCRRFTKEEALKVEQMTKAGVQPRQILSSLRQSNPNLLAISRNIYSKAAQIRKDSLGGRSIIQALLDELGDAGFSHNVEYDQHGHLTHLFFAHPISIELTKNYPDVFVMDCTYKTNKYKMPLLEVIGMSSFNKSFYSCFVFMQKEEEQDYVWALNMFTKLLGDDNHPMAIITDRELALMNAICVVFPRTPNLLCVWHIEKNIAANCKPHFKEDADWIIFLSSWNILIKSADEFTFNEAWNRFEVEYKEYAVVLTYIKNIWLPWKEKFVNAWTGQICHFGNQVTSRAEGAHATLKKYLQVSTGGLREVKEKICLAIQNQFQEIKTQLSSEKIRIPHKLCMAFFRELVTKVSFFALYELHKQYVLANTKDYSSECKGHFFKIMGLPCVHMIRKMDIEVLPLSQIHKQWRIDTRSFSNDHHAILDHESQFNDLLFEIKDKYEKLPLTQKENTKVQLSQILSGSLPLIFEPTIQPHKGRPVGSKKRKETSSTKRKPSQFEIVEKKTRNCSICKTSGHIRTTCPSRDKAT